MANSVEIIQWLTYHDLSFQSVCWSPDGTSVAVAATDGCIWLWRSPAGQPMLLEGHGGWVQSVAWSPDGTRLVSGGNDGTVRLWDAHTGTEQQRLEGHGGWVQSVAWSPDGTRLATGGNDGTVRLWDALSGQLQYNHEGHSGPVTELVWSMDGRLLASCTEVGELMLWNTHEGSLLAQRAGLAYQHHNVSITFGPASPAPALLQLTHHLFVRVWTPALDSAEPAQILLRSAKVVLVGDSAVGKSCLALRLSENRFEEKGSTHGMQVWTLPAEHLDPSAAPPPGERRELFLWDLGGQSEYQLVHQLFLHDTTVALVLFDATRGEANYAAVEDWNQRLELQAKGQRIQKLLVRSKCDLPDGVVNRQQIDKLKQSCGFHNYLEVSASREEDAGLAALRRELTTMLAWEQMARITRPPLYQQVREIIQRDGKRQSVLYVADVLAEVGPLNDRQQAGFDIVLRQLAMEGQLVETQLQNGDRVLVLNIEAVSQYASSLVMAAREHPRQVPLVEIRHALSPQRQFPGIKADKRLKARQDEVLVLQCVMQLMLERGVCLEHSGLLVFPSLFQQASPPPSAALPHPRPLYYDFSGPIDNIYAALVARLDASGGFGGVRMWRHRAEFERPGKGVCGIGREDRNRGRGHLDLYFSQEVSAEDGDLFVSFVESHLREQGVAVLQGLAFSCDCGQ